MDDNQSDASSDHGVRPQLQVLDVELQFGPPSSFERELVQRLQGPILCFNRSNEIILAPIIAHFKSLGYPLENSMISYYSQIVGVYVYCGNDPLPVSISVPLFEVKSGKLILKCREAVRNEFGTVITIGIPASLSMKQYEDSSQPPKASRRTKERKIGYIIEKVSKWRQLYSGSGPEGSSVKYTLEEAASQVGISKKSLDDYLLQLRFGKKFGFNFQEHKDDKVGVLRAYVKKYKSINTHIMNLKANEPISEDIEKLLHQPPTPSCKHSKCCHPPVPVIQNDPKRSPSD